MGTVTNSIGTTGRDYSTIALWEASLPANLVTDGNSYVGQCYNDSEFLITSGITIGSRTTDSTHTITLTTGSGQSFRDHGSVQTNALKYNQSNGVGIRTATNSVTVFTISADYVTVSKLQFNYSNAGYDPTVIKINNARVTIDGCIVVGSLTVGTGIIAMAATGACHHNTITNCLVVNVSIAGYSTSGIRVTNEGACVLVNNTVVIPSDKIPGSGTQYGISVGSGTHYQGTSVCTNNAVFGFRSGFTDDTSNYTGSNNACDLSSTSIPGTSPQASLTYTSQFQGTLNASQDFRAKSGGAIVDNGATDTTDIPAAIDIVGTSRPSGSAWDIGCWELVQAAAGGAWYKKSRSFTGGFNKGMMGGFNG